MQAAAQLVNAAFPLTLPGVALQRGLRDRALQALLAGARGALPAGPNLRSLAIRTLLTDSPRETARLLFDKAVLRALELFE